MNITNQQVVNLSFADFKLFKRQVQFLCRIGYNVQEAVEIVLRAPRFAKF